jgi:hypothetical protein
MREMREEAVAGLNLLKGLIRHTRVNIDEITPLQGREAYAFQFARNSQRHMIVLSGEFLSDFPGTGAYQKSAVAYVEALESRMLNVSVSDFYCTVGIPLQIEIEWPADRIPGYSASAVQVQVHDLRAQDSVAICAVRMTHQQQHFDLKQDPFLRERAVVNSVRGAADRNQLTYFRRAEHPIELPYVDLEVGSRRAENEEGIEEFLLGKIYWLGFKRNERRTPVWIADPWDAEYLGTTGTMLIQAAQTLEAEKMISLDASQRFASAGDGLLIRARSSRITDSQAGPATTGQQPDWNPRPLWDVFVCHASEDKEAFVKPLAEALRKQNLKVWYDEFELRLGDSLRQSIDKGLRDARFGIVVLSHAFFSKPWPQRELDGLTAREVNGKKVILPIWHNLTKEDVLNYSPTLAGKLAVSSSKGLDVVVQEILKALN